ncbi:DoxX family protein [Paenibacillus humicola]|uniref:DoxX family protein n=1 Tax=Paenibacillus humicola TaxID=3110540 RepID=UPI00237A6922|nr:DoxX family protein [Paenibacillus humicola]
MTILSAVLQSLLILAFLFAGSSKLAGVKHQVESFAHLGLPQWFRVVTGLVQYIGVAALVIGFWHPGMAAWAGIWLGITMLLACAAHFKAGDSALRAVPAFVLAVIAVVLVCLNAGDVGHPFS